MYDFEIASILDRKLDQQVYVGPCDLLPCRFSLPAGFVVNLSSSDQDGSHWIGIFIDGDGHGTYFCSFGMKPFVKSIQTFLRFHCKTVTINKTQLQNQQSGWCGEYVVMFMIHSFKGSGLSSFLKLFSTNLIYNDMLIKKMFARAQNFLH